MRILYIAHGIPVPGHLGGSTHAFEAARGLAQRGHTVHLVAASREGWTGVAPFARPVSSMLAGFHLHHQDIPKTIGLAGTWLIHRLARTLRPDVIMERYYNFCGAGVLVAHRLGIPCLLEVNALIVDPPQVLKRHLDDALGGPMRRWAIAQCRMADRIITPLHTTVPEGIPRSRIVELPWGADVERFVPRGDVSDMPSSLCPLLPMGEGGSEAPRTQGEGFGVRSANTENSPPVAIFTGSFRAWHGVTDFVRAAVLLLSQGKQYRFVLVGDGPERAEAERLAAGWGDAIEFVGRVPYDEVPVLLQQATVGVAPFAPRHHPALQAAGFFWSPLKMYEYMATGLPVVTINLHPLNTIIRDGEEGLLVPEEDVAALAQALARLLDDPQAAAAMGKRARARVVAHYSWQHHCAELERVMLDVKRNA